jgi:hypothetical protein
VRQWKEGSGANAPRATAHWRREGISSRV